MKKILLVLLYMLPAYAMQESEKQYIHTLLSDNRQSMHIDRTGSNVDAVLKDLDAPHRTCQLAYDSKDDDNPVGFIAYAVREPGIFEQCCGGKQEGAIELLAIQENARRKKHASLLLKQAICDLKRKDLDTISARINSGNTAAQECFRKNGFEKQPVSFWEPDKWVFDTYKEKMD